MPDTDGRRKRGNAWTLGKSHERGDLILIRCGHCNIKRWYEPSDLIRLFGDVDIELIDGRMLCEKCRNKEFVRAEARHLTALERVGIRVRRLAEIRVVRRVVWKDEE
jgi:hypothetical protein